MAATILTFATKILGPIPQLLILVGNAITPGRGFRERSVLDRDRAA